MAAELPLHFCDPRNVFRGSLWIVVALAKALAIRERGLAAEGVWDNVVVVEVAGTKLRLAAVRFADAAGTLKSGEAGLGGELAPIHRMPQ
jgi:hypothetical protein